MGLCITSKVFEGERFQKYWEKYWKLHKNLSVQVYGQQVGGNSLTDMLVVHNFLHFGKTSGLTLSLIRV